MNNNRNSPDRTYQLVSTVTPDAVKLHGLFQRSSSIVKSSIDAAVVLHGLGGNFYGSTLNLRLADALGELGISVVLGNTRGHDGISMNPVAGRAQTIGAAYEIVDECKQDVTGWVRWLVEHQGYQRIALVGHSLGAIKALYAQAYLPHECVEVIVSLSATRLCYSSFLNSERSEDFRKWIRLSEEMVKQGRGDDLIRVDFPFPVHMTASAYRDKYGPADRYDWTAFAEKINVPTLLVFGERELRDNTAFRGMLETAQHLVQELPGFDLAVIESANHFYAGVHDRATDAMKSWLIRNAG